MHAEVARRTTGHLRLRGTVVGMGTRADLRFRKVTTIRDQDLLISVLALLPSDKDESRSQIEVSNAFPRESAPQILLFANTRLSHEMMLEMMALGVETRSRSWPLREPTKELKRYDGLTEVDWVAVATDQDERFRTDSGRVRQVMMQALLESLKPAHPREFQAEGS